MPVRTCQSLRFRLPNIFDAFHDDFYWLACLRMGCFLELFVAKIVAKFGQIIRLVFVGWKSVFFSLSELYPHKATFANRPFLELSENGLATVLGSRSGSAYCWRARGGRQGVWGVQHLTNWPNSVKPRAKPTPISGFPPISIFGIVLCHFHNHHRQCDSWSWLMLMLIDTD